jgi:hypothetical protein
MTVTLIRVTPVGQVHVPVAVMTAMVDFPGAILPAVVAIATFAEPLMDADPVTAPVRLIVRAVPQLAVVMLAEPLKLVPLIVRAVCRVTALVATVAVEALPVKLPTTAPVSDWQAMYCEASVLVEGLYVNVAVLSCSSP